MDCTFPIAAPPSSRRPLFFDLTLSIMHAASRPLPSRFLCKTNVISPFRCRRRRRRKKSALINAAAESKQTAAFEDGQAGRRTRTPRTRTEPAGGRDGLERMIFPRSGACVSSVSALQRAERASLRARATPHKATDLLPLLFLFTSFCEYGLTRPGPSQP